MNENLQKIFEGMELSEDFKKKFEEIYNARIEEETQKIEESANEAAEEKYSKISEEYAEYIVGEMEDKTEAYINEEVIPSVEKYVDYVAKEFMNENKLVIESETKVSLANRFLSGFSQVAEQYNVVIPEGQANDIEALQAKLDEANQQVEKLMSKSGELEDQITESKKAKIAESVSGDMTETQRERFVESAGRVKFIDESQYESAMQELKESFSPEKDKSKESLNENQKEEGTQERVTESDSWMDNLLSRV